MSRIARVLIASLLALPLSHPYFAADVPRQALSAPAPEAVFPAAEWATAPPERFGFSTAKLEEVRAYFEAIGGDACVVVRSGYVIASWGEVAAPIGNRSIRKSFLNSLLGIEYGKGTLDLDATLADLEINDKDGLTSRERSARVRHLLTANSGVFHQAAYESKEQKGARPPRGTFAPGDFFYYSNWDFNALGAIYQQVAGKDIFEAFRDRIATVIGMQDFDLTHTRYVYDKASAFPAYLFASSARDDARFGYLYLRNGRWGDRQVLPAEWVGLSSTAQITTGDYYYYDYGFLFWVDAASGQYFARGNSGQYIAVLPREDMVVVFRADPGSIVNKWLRNRVKPQESFLLIPKILSARSEE